MNQKVEKDYVNASDLDDLKEFLQAKGFDVPNGVMFLAMFAGQAILQFTPDEKNRAGVLEGFAELMQCAASPEFDDLWVRKQ